MIREVIERDYEQLMLLYAQLRNNPVPKRTQEMMNLWHQILHDKNHHIIVAEADEKIVSSCVCVIIPNLTHDHQPYALVENVITDKDYRCQGWATQCLNYAKEIAYQENCYKIMLMTGTSEEGILQFYEQAGYNRNDKTGFIQWI